MKTPNYNKPHPPCHQNLDLHLPPQYDELTTALYTIK